MEHMHVLHKYIYLNNSWRTLWSPSATFSRRQNMLRSTDAQQFRWPKFQCCRPACVEQLATAPTTRHELRAFPA